MRCRNQRFKLRRQLSGKRGSQVVQEAWRTNSLQGSGWRRLCEEVPWEEFSWEENGRMEKIFGSLENDRIWIKVFSRRKKVRLCFNMILERVSFRWLLKTECLCPPQFMCWSPNPQCDGVWKWGLWGVIRLRWGQGDPAVGLVSLQEELDQSSLSLYHMRTQWEGDSQQARKRVFIRNWVFWHLDPGCPSLQNCEK